MSISRLEQETIINYNEEEKTATVYTFNRGLKAKLAKLAAERPEDCVLSEDYANGSQTYTVPKRWIKVSPPRKVSEEQKKAAAERMAAWRASRNQN